MGIRHGMRLVLVVSAFVLDLRRSGERRRDNRGIGDQLVSNARVGRTGFRPGGTILSGDSCGQPTATRSLAWAMGAILTFGDKTIALFQKNRTASHRSGSRHRGFRPSRE